MCPLSLNHSQDCPPQVPPHVPATVPCHPIMGKGQRRLESFLEGPCVAFCKGWQVSEAALRAGCSCEHEVTSPGSAQQPQATAMSKKCSCSYSCSLFPLPFVCRRVTADASHQHNGHLDSFGAGTSNCNPANKTLCLSELSQRFVNPH